MSGVGGSTPTTNFSNFTASSNTPGAQSSGQPQGAVQKEQAAIPQWNKSGDDDQSVKDALAFLNGDASTQNTKGANTGPRLAELQDTLPSSYDWAANSKNPPPAATVTKWNDGVKKLEAQNLDPLAFEKQLQTLAKTCSPRPGEKQIFIAKVENVQALAKAGKLTAPSPAVKGAKSDLQAWMSRLQQNLSMDLQFDAGVDAQCGLSLIDGFDPSQDQSVQDLTKALSGGEDDS